MKLGIVWRTGIAMALIGVLASGLTGYYGYTESRALLQSAAEQRLLTATRVLARQLSVGLDNASRDVLMVAHHPGTLGLLQTWDSQPPNHRGSTMAALFDTILRTHPEYFQMRLIAAADHGAERVRVDRSEEGLARIFEEDLQEKGHYPYVMETLRLPPGAVYVSRASINHELGAHAGQHRPSLQVATPVHDAQDKVLGLIVVNIDLDRLFKQLAADLPATLSLYLSNSQGDFLIHPDPTLAFAFDRGQRALVQDAFPDTRKLIGEQVEDGAQQLVTLQAADTPERALVAAFVRQPIVGLHNEEGFVIGLGQPLRAVLADADQLGRTSLRIVLAFSALAIVLAALLARRLSNPLQQLLRALREFGQGSHDAPLPLPVTRHDEFGTLARAMAEMQTQISGQFASLALKQQELDRLASHDALTGLPNRRLFMDRLTQALARARRNQSQLALLFVDLDNFKDINDSLGHAAGDDVLNMMSQRMSVLVREVDTVARLGGDEFIILLDGADNRAEITQIAQRMVEALQQPVVYQGHVLNCGGSIGISCFPDDATDMTALIAAADQAMYLAKQSGRNQLRFASTQGGSEVRSGP
ncbi:GGDEF domain-containing protein [Aquabacterium sp.]|uniref:GGDEF domain-containing protein n=1 Tax=Aquabacterium sp. TaxID=1872578 RepID=UPI0027BA1D8E|nr:GGDEF domain-containing protein [Aquabacterium sp.]